MLMDNIFRLSCKNVKDSQGLCKFDFMTIILENRYRNKGGI